MHLSDAVLESDLLKKFPSLHAFREEYKIPLTIKFPGDIDIELAFIKMQTPFAMG